MSELAGLVGAVALLCVGCALLVYQRGQRHAREQLARALLDSRIAAQSAARGVAGIASMPAADAPRPAGNDARTVSSGQGATHANALADRLLARFAAAVDRLERRAGIADLRKLAMLIGASGVALALPAWLRLGASGVAIAFAVVAGAAYCWLARRIAKRRRRLVMQLPPFLDGIVRLIVLGNSVPAAFQAAHLNTEAPLRECLDQVVRKLRGGMEIDRALSQAALMWRADELEMVGAVLRLSVRYGGRTDVMLERMANFMRDFEQAQRELVAMSAETRVSGWVLTALPIGIGAFMVVTNPRLFHGMWSDPSGRTLICAAAALQLLGTWLLQRMTRLRS